MKNKIILIGGVLAAGKSTFSMRLSKFLNVPCFNKDNIKEIMGDGYGSQSGEVFKKGSAVTFQLMMHIAERFLIANQPCILESNFRIFEGELLKEMFEKYNCECLTYTFGGDLDIIAERHVKRDVIRHWVHLKSEDKQVIKNYAISNKLADFSVGKTVFVDGTYFDKIDYPALFDIAKQFILE